MASESPPEPYDFEALEDRLTGLYHDLADQAEELYLRATPGELESTREFLDHLEWRAPLDEVRGYMLAARHELHGAITALIKYHGRIAARRPTDGDPDDYQPPCAHDPS